MSGFWRPSPWGRVENGDSRPGLTEPPKLTVVFPLQSSQNRFDVHEATVIRSTALPGSLTSSSLFWLPVTKFAVVLVLLKKRHRSTSPSAGPSATGIIVNVQVPFIVAPPVGFGTLTSM